MLLGVDVRGLPTPFSIDIYPSYDRTTPTDVHVLLQSDKRSAVVRWAKRLGVEVTDEEPRQAIPGGPMTRAFVAVREKNRIRLRVWTSAEIETTADQARTNPEEH